MRYDFLIDTQGTERTEVLSVWSEFLDDDLPGSGTGPQREDAAVDNQGVIRDVRATARWVFRETPHQQNTVRAAAPA